MRSSSLLLILLLSVFATALAQLCTSDADCNSSGRCIALRCSCYSGFAGNTCQLQKVPQCGWNTPDPLKTKFPPVIDPLACDFHADTLTVVMKAPFVQDRYNYDIWTIGHANNPNCTYPGPFWTKSLDNGLGCGDRFTMTEPWAIAKTCGWNLTETTNYQIYNVNYMIRNTEKVGVGKDGFPLIRTNEHSLKMAVRFLKTVWVYSTITSFSTLDPLFAITKQIYNPITSTAELELTSQLQYPFRYASPLIIQLPPPLTGFYTDVSDPLSCPPAGVCTQKWKLTLNIPPGVCEFTGIYVTNLTQACHPSVAPADCPVPPNANHDQVIADIMSEDFCAVVKLDIGLNGFMLPYSDSSWSVNKNTFLYGQRAFFKGELTTNGQATLLSMNISHVVLSYWANALPYSRVLRMNGTNSQEGSSLAMHHISAYACGFSFDINNDTTPVPFDDSSLFGVMARYVVTFRDNSGVSTRSFDMLFDTGAGNTQDTKLSTEFSVAKVNTVAGATTNKLGAAVLLIALLAFVFI